MKGGATAPVVGPCGGVSCDELHRDQSNGGAHDHGNVAGEAACLQRPRLLTRELVHAVQRALEPVARRGESHPRGERAQAIDLAGRECTEGDRRHAEPEHRTDAWPEAELRFLCGPR